MNTKDDIHVRLLYLIILFLHNLTIIPFICKYCFKEGAICCKINLNVLNHKQKNILCKSLHLRQRILIMVYLGVIASLYLLIILFIVGYTAFNTWVQVYGLKRYNRKVSKKLFRSILLTNLVFAIILIIYYICFP